MKRPLKFRVWSNRQKKMVGLGMGMDVHDGKLTLECIDDCPVMQFINHKDKNGTEIFEDDIVLVKVGETELMKGRVVFYKCKWVIRPDNGGSIDIYNKVGSKRDLEVVGNIYKDRHV